MEKRGKPRGKEGEAREEKAERKKGREAEWEGERAMIDSVAASLQLQNNPFP